MKLRNTILYCDTINYDVEDDYEDDDDKVNGGDNICLILTTTFSLLQLLIWHLFSIQPYEFHDALIMYLYHYDPSSTLSSSSSSPYHHDNYHY